MSFFVKIKVWRQSSREIRPVLLQPLRQVHVWFLYSRGWTTIYGNVCAGHCPIRFPYLIKIWTNTRVPLLAANKADFRVISRNDKGNESRECVWSFAYDPLSFALYRNKRDKFQTDRMTCPRLNHLDEQYNTLYSVEITRSFDRTSLFARKHYTRINNLKCQNHCTYLC